MTTLDQIKALIGDQAGIPASDVRDDITFRSIGLDSLDRLELAIKVGEHFGFEIPDEDVNNEALGTAAGLADYVYGRMAAAAIDASKEVINQHVADAAIYGIGIKKDGKRVAPEEFYWTPPITRDELLRRGVAEDGESDKTMLAVMKQLGWPTAEEPLGRNPTHALIEVEALSRLLDAQPVESAVATHSGIPGVRFHRRDADVEAVQFREIEVVDGTARSVFNLPSLPQWLLDAHALAEGDENALWIVREPNPAGGHPAPSHVNVLMLGGTHGGSWPVRPGQWITFNPLTGKVRKEDQPEFVATYEPVDDAGEAHEPL